VKVKSFSAHINVFETYQRKVEGTVLEDETKTKKNGSNAISKSNGKSDIQRTREGVRRVSPSSGGVGAAVEFTVVQKPGLGALRTSSLGYTYIGFIVAYTECADYGG
jgi:hypothetical protein